MARMIKGWLVYFFWKFFYCGHSLHISFFGECSVRQSFLEVRFFEETFSSGSLSLLAPVRPGSPKGPRDLFKRSLSSLSRNFWRDFLNGSGSLLVSFFLSLLFLLERKSKQKVQGRRDRSARASVPRHNDHPKLVSKIRYTKQSGLHRIKFTIGIEAFSYSKCF